VTTSKRLESGSLEVTEISFRDFDVSWAGCHPRVPQFWFGSDDGRILVRSDLASDGMPGPIGAAPSRDAINGIAWVPGLIAASTRSEVVLLYPDTASPELRFTRGVFPGGAHGVAGTPSGRIVGAMGRHGLLMVGPREITDQRVRIIKPPGESLNLYKVVCVSSPGIGEVLACASRKSGFLAMPLIGGELGDSGKTFRLRRQILSTSFQWTRKTTRSRSRF
jgi:hypothetical protein